MDSFFQYLIYIHAIAGGITLLAAPVAILADKQGSLHRKAGLAFFWAMVVVCISAFVAATIQFSLFLLIISVFSFYSAYSGYRITKLRGLHQGQVVPWYDWVVQSIGVIFMLGMLGFGLYLWLSGSKNQVYILMIIFGLLGINGVRNNIIPFRKRPSDGRYFYTYHFGNMLGGFIAASTAFTVQTLGRLFPEAPGLIFWLGPTVLIVPVIIYYSRKYRNVELEKLK